MRRLLLTMLLMATSAAACNIPDLATATTAVPATQQPAPASPTPAPTAAPPPSSTPGEAEDPAEGPAVSITSPAAGAEINVNQPITVTGTGRGLFEGNVVIQILDAEGNVLIEEPTIAAGTDVGVGGPGEWSIELTLDAQAGSAGTIYAFTTSPRDGSVTASDEVQITFTGE